MCRPPGEALSGKHRNTHPAHPYAAAALLAVALIVAGAGAALSHPRFPGHADLGGAAADAVIGEAAGVGPVGPGSAAPPTGAPSTAPAPAPTTGAPTAAPRPASPPSPTRSLSRIERLENEVTTLVNRERAKAGCGAVRTDERLRTAARAHSGDMAANNYFSHTGRDGSSPWDRAGRAGYAQANGENIAYGYATTAAVMEGWMNSEGHRANILNCASKATGAGLAYRGSTPYWTQLFGRV